MSTPNAIAVTSSKGGVLKTSLVANIGGLAARGGWRTLCIDADPQGDLAHDLGFGGRSDGGESLARAITTGERPVVIEGVRPGLDVVAGGEHLRRTIEELHRRSRRDTSHVPSRGPVAALATHYDLVLIDTPPGDAVLRRQLTAQARYSVVPTAPDAASMAGLANIARDLDAIRHINPDHELLAVVLGPVGSAAREIRRSARHQLSAILGRPAPVLMSTIRLAQKVAVDCREVGQLVIEYEADAMGLASEPGWKRFGSRKRYSTAASGLADDYQQLADEVLERLVARQGEATRGPVEHGARVA